MVTIVTIFKSIDKGLSATLKRVNKHANLATKSLKRLGNSTFKVKKDLSLMKNIVNGVSGSFSGLAARLKSRIFTRLSEDVNSTKLRFKALQANLRVFSSTMMGTKASVRGLRGNLKRLQLTVNAYRVTANAARTATRGFGRSLISLGKWAGSSVTKFATMRRRFQGWALSIMFFGMMIQRVFMNIVRRSFKVFNEVMQSAQGGVSNIQMLGASFQYLGFVVGNAINEFLGPLMPKILEIVGVVSEWIENNKELTAKIIIWGLVIGTVLMAVGQLVLGLGGLFVMFAKIGHGITILVRYITKVPLVWGKWKVFGSIVGKTVGFLAILWGVFRIFAGWFQGDWWKIVSGVFLAIAGIVAFVFGGWVPALIVGIIAAITWLGDRFKWVRWPIAIVAQGMYWFGAAVWYVIKAIIKLLGLLQFWKKKEDRWGADFDMSGEGNFNLKAFDKIMAAPTKKEKEEEGEATAERNRLLAENEKMAEETALDDVTSSVNISGDVNISVQTDEMEKMMDELKALGG